MFSKVFQRTILRNPLTYQMALRQQTQLSCMVPIAARQIHARGYTKFDDHYSFISNEINFALNNAKNTTNIVFIY